MLIQLLPYNLLCRAEENREKSHDSRCPIQDAKRSPAKYKSRALLPCLSAMSYLSHNCNYCTRCLRMFYLHNCPDIPFRDGWDTVVS